MDLTQSHSGRIKMDRNFSGKEARKGIVIKIQSDYRGLPVGGRLQRFRNLWKDSPVERLISRGLTWTWKSKPPPRKELYQHTTPALDMAVHKMYKKKAIFKAKKILGQSRLFTIPKKDSIEERLIMDLSWLNQYIECPTFKMLTLKEIKLLLPLGFWTVSLDLKDGFWHLSMFYKLRPYLGFEYRNQLWQFRVMPFGLNVAPRIFTKLIAYMIKIMAAEGIWCLPFLDDLLIIAATKEECLLKLEKARKILEEHGWIIHLEKSRLEPQQVFQWLGIQYDLVAHTRSASEASLDALHSNLKSLITSQTCTKREIMKLQGLANWVGQVNPISRLMLSRTKNLLKIFRKPALDTVLKLKMWMKLSLVKWLHIPQIPQRLGNPSPHLVIQTDASQKGWGFKVNKRGYQGIYDDSMLIYSINILELLTIWYALLMIDKKNLVIQILSDNSTAVSAVRKCTSNQFHIAMIAELIWRRATTMMWTLQIEHIKGSFNVLADQLSRNTVLSTEWSLRKEDFYHIIKLNKYLQVDLFATSLNNQLQTFISPCPDESAEGVNAMSIDWEKWDHLYLYPPTSMISKALSKLLETKFQSAIMVTPNHPAKPWFMALKQLNTPSVKMEVKLQQKVGNKLVMAKQPTTLIVWKLSGKYMKRNCQVVKKQ